jgi:hypothetical protein
MLHLSRYTPNHYYTRYHCITRSVHVLTGKLFPVWSAVEGAILKVEGSKGTKVRVTVVQECGEEFDPEEEVIMIYIYY